MVDLFASIEFQRTPLFFVFRNILDECFTSLMDDGWDVKHTTTTDVIKCVVSKDTVVSSITLGGLLSMLLFRTTGYKYNMALIGKRWIKLNPSRLSF